MDFNPNTAVDDSDPAPTPAENMESGQTCWNAMLGEAHKVIQVTLEELALLAGLATAATEGPCVATAADSARSSADAALPDTCLLSLRT